MQVIQQPSLPQHSSKQIFFFFFKKCVQRRGRLVLDMRWKEREEEDKREEVSRAETESAAQKIDLWCISVKHYTAGCEPAAHPADFSIPIGTQKIMSL